MKNSEVADLFSEIGDYLEIKGEEFKPRAYRRAARNIESLSEDIETIYDRDELSKIEGVGDALEDKIREYLETGELEFYNRLNAELPVAVDSLTRVEGLGPKSVKALYEELGVQTLEDLESAAEAGDIASVSGFGEKTQQNILDNIEFAKRSSEQWLYGKIVTVVNSVEEYLSEHDAVHRIEVVGSFRRRVPTVGDIDALVTGKPVPEIHDIFVEFPDVSEVLQQGETRTSVRLTTGVQVDLRVVAPDEYGAALQYFTGSMDHNIALRNRAISRGWKLNEYGLFDETDEVIAGSDERDIYAALDLSWIPPELREDTGEITAAASDSLPELVTLGDIRGDLHMHTARSDGVDSVRDMGEKAEQLGYEYILITDHGPSLTIGNGISRDEFTEQQSQITAANAELDVTVLHGIEANITGDGIDISREWAAACDIVVFSLHNQVADATERITSVMRDYPVDVFAHPQNRLLNQREGIDLDFPSIMDVADDEGIAIEINAQPNRLDLDWRLVKDYRESVNFVVSTDAHRLDNLEHMEFGVCQARKGWCSLEDIVNTWPVDEVLEWMDRA